MKRILIASALALAAAVPAFAADLPPPVAPAPRAPVVYVPAQIFSWTGFYVGINGGWGFGQSTWTPPVGTISSFSTNGGMLGGTLGGNYQIGQFVVGGEGDVDWLRLALRPQPPDQCLADSTSERCCPKTTPRHFRCGGVGGVARPGVSRSPLHRAREQNKNITSGRPRGAKLCG